MIESTRVCEGVDGSIRKEYGEYHPAGDLTCAAGLIPKIKIPRDKFERSTLLDWIGSCFGKAQDARDSRRSIRTQSSARFCQNRAAHAVGKPRMFGTGPLASKQMERSMLLELSGSFCVRIEWLMFEAVVDSWDGTARL